MSMPMPPCTCWVVAATRAPASAAQNFAMRAARSARPVVRDQPGRMPGGPADRLDVDEGVGHPLLDRLKAADRAAELLAPAGVFGGDPQRTIADAELDRAQPDQSAGVERVDRTVEPVLCGNDCAIEEYVRVRLVVGGRRRPDLNAVRLAGQQEQAHVTVVGGGGNQYGVGDLGGGHQLLGAVQPPVRTVATRGGGGTRRVGATRLGQPRGQDASARDDLGQKALLLLRGAVPGDRVGAQHQRRVGGHRRDAGAHLGQQHPEFHEAAARPAQPLRQRGPEQVGGREFLPQRGVVADFAGFEFGEALGAWPGARRSRARVWRSSPALR